jgi:hypothetical protein
MSFGFVKWLAEACSESDFDCGTPCLISRVKVRAPPFRVFGFGSGFGRNTPKGGAASLPLSTGCDVQQNTFGWLSLGARG